MRTKTIASTSVSPRCIESLKIFYGLTSGYDLSLPSVQLFFLRSLLLKGMLYIMLGKQFSKYNPS